MKKTWIMLGGWVFLWIAALMVTGYSANNWRFWAMFVIVLLSVNLYVLAAVVSED